MKKMKPQILTPMASEVAKARYFMEGETWSDCAKRVGTVIGSLETNRKYVDKFIDIIESMLFIPAGRTLRNSGRPKGSLLNCFVLPIGDSIEEIGQFYKEALILWSEGGGVGCNFSPLRPKGAIIRGKGGESSGLVSFLEGSDFLSERIESGGSRRAAAIGLVVVHHPEIFNYIDAKLKHNTLSHYNISVGITNEFLDAVEQDAEWTLHFNQQVYQKLPARTIWRKIIENMIACAEPGLLNLSNLYSNNSYYFAPISSTNPCITGDTKIYVAGVGPVEIKKLVEDGKDIPVCAWGSKTQQVMVSMGRNPRLTQKNAKILKIMFNDGTSIRVTENHKFPMHDESKVEAKDLKIGDQLVQFFQKNNDHRITNIIDDGYEDVYNITVDDYHNYAVVLKENDKEYSGIFVCNCGEVPLENYGACNLGSLVLPKFIKGEAGTTNWKLLEETIRTAVRFLDDVIDINKYPINKIQVACQNSRRIGMGVMGLGEYLFAKRIRYGSPQAVNEAERLFKFIREVAYRTSIELAIEKGSFPKFDPIPYGKAHFVRTLPPSIRMDIKKHGIRNVTLMALAPTGTTSLVANVTSGIEPLFSKGYKRKDRIGERAYIHPLTKKFVTNNEFPDWFVDAYDLTPAEHLDMQIACQKYVDGAVSKTINMPKDSTPEELDSLLLEYARDCKGVTVYVDGSRNEQVCYPLTHDEILKELQNNKVVDDSNGYENESKRCSSGKCDL